MQNERIRSRQAVYCITTRHTPGSESTAQRKHRQVQSELVHTFDSFSVSRASQTSLCFVTIQASLPSKSLTLVTGSLARRSA